MKGTIRENDREKSSRSVKELSIDIAGHGQGDIYSR